LFVDVAVDGGIACGAANKTIDSKTTGDAVSEAARKVIISIETTSSDGASRITIGEKTTSNSVVINKTIGSEATGERTANNKTINIAAAASVAGETAGGTVSGEAFRGGAITKGTSGSNHPNRNSGDKYPRF
jgi:hypothetical protein